MSKRSQSVQLKRRVMEGVEVRQEDIRIGAPVFFPTNAPGSITGCRFEFLGERPRNALAYTRRGVWLGLYRDKKKDAASPED